MHRLTLILSDLYLPEEAELVGGAAVHELPTFEWLLRRSDKPRRVLDWRAWLAAQLPADRRVLVEPDADTWFATPVQLEVRLDHVRLVDRGLLRLDAAERAAASAEFARAFGPKYVLHPGHDRGFTLSGIAPVVTRTVDPARLLGSDIGAALPGREATELRRLGAEIEMWLHGAAFNAARVRAGKPRVSTLWLWRGAGAQPPSTAKTIDGVFLGSDPFIETLVRNGQSCDFGPPLAFDWLAPGHTHVIAEFAPVTGAAHERLPALEQHWFAPAKAALLAGTLAEIELVANDRVFRVGPGARWRFWRRRTQWLARLAADARDAEA